MKKYILSLLVAFGFIGMANAADMAIYYSPTCPHCHHAQDFTKNTLLHEYPNMHVTLIDVTVPENRNAFIDVLKSCDFSSGGVPVIKIGEKCFQGFGDSMADELRAAIEVDMADDAKKSAADVKKALKDDGEKYRASHPAPLENITEYTAPAAPENAEQPKKASDNKWASWILVAIALIVLGFSVSMGRKKNK